MKSLATLAAFLLLSSAPILAQRGGGSGGGRSGGYSGGGGHYGGGGGGHYGGGGGGHYGGGGYYHGGANGGYGYGRYGYRGGAVYPYYSYPFYSYIPSFGFGYGSVYPGSVSDYGYGYSGGYAEPAPPPDYSANYAPAPQQPPVIINQTFVNGMPAGSAQPDPQGGQPADPNIVGETRTYQSPAPTPQEWAMSEGHYYLIAYKDHSVYTALAYWMEGGALHYVTPQNVHNQVSLDLLDLGLTKKLNAGRGLSFNPQLQR